MSFALIKIPEKSGNAHIYYKQYQPSALKQQLGIVEIDSTRTLYAIQLTGPINPHVANNIFRAAGKIESVHTGQFANRHNNKSKRKMFYFALIVYKTAESLQISLDRDKLQAAINHKFKETPALISLPPEEVESTV